MTNDGFFLPKAIYATDFSIAKKTRSELKKAQFELQCELFFVTARMILPNIIMLKLPTVLMNRWRHGLTDQAAVFAKHLVDAEGNFLSKDKDANDEMLESPLKYAGVENLVRYGYRDENGVWYRGVSNLRQGTTFNFNLVSQLFQI